MAGRMPFSSSMPDMFDPYAAIRPAYMRGPVQRPAAYYFLKTILIAGGIAGGMIALYRNDVFLELSRRVGQESRYFEAERYLGVTPGWGTPRSMQPVLEGQSAGQPVASPTLAAPERPVAAPAAEATTTSASSPIAAVDAPPTNAPPEPTSNAPIAAATPESAPAARLAAAPVAAAPVAAAPTETGKPAFDPLAPVSLDSLPLLPRGARAPAAAPVVEAAPVAVTRPAASPTKSRAAAVSLDEEADEPAPKRSRKVREAEPEPAPVAKAPKPAPEPKGPKTEPNPHDNPLTASIRAAVRARPAKNTVD